MYVYFEKKKKKMLDSLENGVELMIKKISGFWYSFFFFFIIKRKSKWLTIYFPLRKFKIGGYDKPNWERKRKKEEVNSNTQWRPYSWPLILSFLSKIFLANSSFSKGLKYQYFIINDIYNLTHKNKKFIPSTTLAVLV